MSEQYTPNTESVRESITYLAKYHAEGQHGDVDLAVVESEVQGQFDRWLEQVKEEAWDEALATCVPDDVDILHAVNPYREEKENV